MPNPLRQALLEFYAIRLQAHAQRLSRIQSANERHFERDGFRYWSCTDTATGLVIYKKRNLATGKVTLISKKEYELALRASGHKPDASTKRSSKPHSIQQSPRLSPDRIKQVAQQKELSVSVGKHTIPLKSFEHDPKRAAKTLEAVCIDPVVVSERLLSGIVDTAQFTKGEVTYVANKILLSYRSDSNSKTEFNRLFTRDDNDELIVTHVSFKLPPTKQKGGNAVNMMADALPVYDELGVSKINIEAVEVGKYAWLKLGFTPNAESAALLSKNISALLQEVKTQFPTIPKRAIRQIKNTLDMMSIVPRAAWDLADNDAKMPDGKQTIANYLLVNCKGKWKGDFDMTDTVTRKRCQEYIDEKLSESS